MQSSKLILSVLTGATLAMITSAAVFASDAITEHQESPATELRSDVTPDTGKRHEDKRQDGAESEQQGQESEEGDEETSEQHEAK